MPGPTLMHVEKDEDTDRYFEQQLSRAHHKKMQFSYLYFGHGLFDPLTVTFQGQTLLSPV